ncbi:hypothetical protein F5Y14DRAFT_272241 [Nemania sp. NC0429]|nr:hypothetical protein F5Y14DRAFT_272241 [Nemania sp. NC0429]
MEALAAVSLAGNILQFASTAKKVVSASRQLRDVGSTEEHDELDAVIRDLRLYLARIKPPEAPHTASRPLHPPTKEEKSLRALCVQCDEVAQVLLDKLERLKPKYQDGKLGHAETIYLALLSVWGQEEIDKLRNRVETIATNIERHLAAYDRNRLFQRLDELQSENRRLEAYRTAEIAQLREVFDNLFKDIGRRLREEESRSQTVAALLEAARQGSCFSMEQIILEQLRFDSIDRRHELIHNAHEETFQWTFDAEERESPATFSDWLTSDNKVYWISGKPGSGKSTLMKFLSSHPRTAEALEAWAGQSKLVRAEFFFWNAGKDELQKSQEGLMRSLLYQILRHCPDLIPVAYPSIWSLQSLENNTETQGLLLSASKGLLVPLSDTGLRETLQKISLRARESQTKFCFFIDGLDEYHGKPDAAIQLMGDLGKFFNAKMCLSSRSWNEFEEKFGKVGTRKLYMQDFNAVDITRYINATFERDENFQELEGKDTDGAELIKEIGDASNGVFLWVFLVVRSFQEGLTNGDGFPELRKRLQELPTDLDEYFKNILVSNIDEFYHGHSAQMFLVTLEAAEELPLIAYWFMGDEDSDYPIKLERKKLSIGQLNKRMKQMKKRLNAYSKGLLEVQEPPSKDEEDSLPSSIYFKRSVNFLHRTVRDYLNLDRTRQMLRKWCSPNFDADEAICKALVAQINSSPEGNEYRFMIERLLRLFNTHRERLKLPYSYLCGLKELRGSLVGVYDLPESDSEAGPKEPEANHEPKGNSVVQSYSGESQASQPETTTQLTGQKDGTSQRFRRKINRLVSRFQK